MPTARVIAFIACRVGEILKGGQVHGLPRIVWVPSILPQSAIPGSEMAEWLPEIPARRIQCVGGSLNSGDRTEFGDPTPGALSGHVIGCRNELAAEDD